MSFVCPRELVSFDPRHVMHSEGLLKSVNVFEVGIKNINFSPSQGCPLISMDSALAKT